jgi:hypothetical protein
MRSSLKSESHFQKENQHPIFEKARSASQKPKE